MSRHSPDVREISYTDEGIFIDIDTPTTEELMSTLDAVGETRLMDLVRPDGSLGLPEEQLEMELRQLGFGTEWQQVKRYLGVTLGMSVTAEEIERFDVCRNALFLRVTSGQLDMEPLLATLEDH